MLAGLMVARTYGFMFRCASQRVRAGCKAAPIAKEADALVCCGLGIIQDGQVVSEALEAFAARFKDQVHPQVLAALRALFKLVSPEDATAEEALIGHGGAQALDVEDEAAAISDV